MKRKTLLWTIITLTLFNLSVSAALKDFEGEWENTNSQTRGVTKINISVSGERVTTHIWGKCHPTDCDWGISEAKVYAPDPMANLNASAQALSSRFSTRGINSLVIFKMLGNGLLQAEVFVEFSSNDSRSDFSHTETLRQISRNPSDNNGSLSAPVLISPAEGTVFNHFPRKTKLVWNPVSGAVSYIVEIDYYYPQKWASDVNPDRMRRERAFTNEFEFNFVGAQPGRWRVTAIDSQGAAGIKSEWRGFRYTR